MNEYRGITKLVRRREDLPPVPRGPPKKMLDKVLYVI
jgi:hypothetical protein